MGFRQNFNVHELIGLSLTQLGTPKADPYSKTCLKRPLKNRQNKDLTDKINGSLYNEGPKYCRMLHEEHSAILLACIKQ